MKTKIIILILAIAAVILGYIFWPCNCGPEAPSSTISPSTPVATTDERIKVDTPVSFEKIQSPLVVRGEARGTWYFEASFPVKLVDGNGKVLIQTHAQANGEWMTTEFVPFEVTLTFPVPETETGTLILERDNPSGLPENDASIRIPVVFK
jgi:hypothetical protein